MSRWLSGLSQVSNLLEKLDGTVENVVEERVIASDDVDVAIDNQVIIDDILSKRGLEADFEAEVEGATDDLDGDDDGDNDKDGETEIMADLDDHFNNNVGLGTENPVSDNNNNNNNDNDNNESDDNSNNIDPIVNTANTANSVVTNRQSDVSEAESNNRGVAPAEGTQPPNHQQKERVQLGITKSPSLGESAEHKASHEVNDERPTKNDIAVPSDSTATIPVNTTKPRKDSEVSVASKEAQKEVRVLRRHIVKLNSTLEQAEAEITALRDELGRAAERMEKDRLRAKDLKEAAQKRHAEELAANKKQHDQALKEQQNRFEEQLETYKSKLHELEHRRKQEGGDWNKEIAQAYEREQEMSNRVALLEYVSLLWET